jgi:hypothetical protein
VDFRLTESLGLPLRERNELLLKVGYAPAYPQTPLDGPTWSPSWPRSRTSAPGAFLARLPCHGNDRVRLTRHLPAFRT